MGEVTYRSAFRYKSLSKRDLNHLNMRAQNGVFRGLKMLTEMSIIRCDKYILLDNGHRILIYRICSLTLRLTMFTTHLHHTYKEDIHSICGLPCI
jgi:hypothetical protein